METSSHHRRTHPELVRDLVKPGDEILATMTPGRAHLLHMVVGVAGEAGELLDCVKQMVIYNKTLDLENLREELGDIEFYLEGIRQIFGWDREGILKENVAKLTLRHGQRFSDAMAQIKRDHEQQKAPRHD